MLGDFWLGTAAVLTISPHAIMHRVPRALATLAFPAAVLFQLIVKVELEKRPVGGPRPLDEHW